LKPVALVFALIVCNGALAGVTAQQTSPTSGPPQWVPPDPTNLQVLPKTIAKRDLVTTMRAFTRSLGVRCPFCHVGKEGDDLSTFDFASDDKPEKKTARLMIKMLADVNAQLATIGDKATGEPRVTCYSCHRGEKKPLTDRPAGG
jgi:photosynthetic reaction center cytochrome c subunit